MNFARHFFILVAFFFLRFYSLAQKEIFAQRIDEEVVLDGEQQEAFWHRIAIADSFMVNFPRVGEVSPFRSEVKFAYDNQAIYVAAQLYDTRPDSVLAFLSQRDDFGNADYFGVLIDPYGAGQNGFGFYVTAAGVELDAIVSQNSFDYTWNAVWKSKVVRTDSGWSLELRIPLSQLRFPQVAVQQWKINYTRQVRRNRETSYWSDVDPQKFGELAQSGNLKGLEQLVSPLRLSFSPYTTAYIENYYNAQSATQDWRFRQRFGMDMKYGLSESFTLDATLVPDFGQTVSDKLVLNLSPFEIRYNENRPFFLEGMDLFGISDIFYTRRIGDQVYLGQSVVDSLQQAGNEIVSAPSLAQLVNATKISGRTKKGLGVGVFNAVEKRSYVVYKDSSGVQREALAHPLSNYNVTVLSQNLKNSGNVSFINTNVFRSDIQLVANVSSLDFLLLTKSRKYSLGGNSQFSVNQRSGNMSTGHTAYLSFAKVGGSMTYNMDYYECSDTYDPNELGFLPRNNYRGLFGQMKWVDYQRKRNMLRRTFTTYSNVEYLYAPSKFAYWNLDASTVITYKNFLTTGFEAQLYPFKEVDHFESRTFGIPVNFPQSMMLGGFYSSDYSKKYALDISLYNRVYALKGMNNLDAEVSPRMRLSSKLFVVLSSSVSRYTQNYGYVNVTDTNYSDQIFMGVRNRWIVNNSVSADYTFTNRMGLRFALNHYWQEVNYSAFRVLQNDGTTIESTYTGRDEDGNSYHNTTFDAFTMDVNFRWVIYPGSEIRLVWKYNIYASKNGLDLVYFNTFKDLFSQPQLNSFSVKALFFLDAGKWRSNRREKDQRQRS